MYSEKLLFCYLAVLYCQIAFTQNHDINFINRSTPHGSGTKIRYNSEINDIELDTFQWNGTISGSQIFSDKNGKFLCYYNCRNVYDSIGRIAINGDNMAVGFFQNYLFSFLPEHEGLGNRTNCAFIPITDSLFYLLYMSSELWSGAKDFEVNFKEGGYFTSSYSKGLYLSKLRLRSDNRIFINENEKHIKITNELYQYNNLITCKHANGKDWWIMIPHAEDERADLFLINENGSYQEFSEIEFSNNYWRIRSDCEFTLTNDGKFLARLIVRPIENFKHILELFRFNRCEGDLELIEIDSIVLPELYTSASDIVFSDNGNFLYLAIGTVILQYELDNLGKIVSKDTIGIWDGYMYQGFLQPIFDVFWKIPNGRILVASGISTPYLHLIEEPNKSKDSCQFIQRAYRFPDDALNLPFGVDIERLPRYPPYRMQAYDCTSASEGNPGINSIKIFPTITTNYIYVDNRCINNVFVYNSLGHFMEAISSEIIGNELRIDLGHMTSGIYFVTLNCHSQFPQTFKVIKI